MGWAKRIELTLSGMALLLLAHASTAVLGSMYYVAVHRATYGVAVEPLGGSVGVAVALGLAFAALAYSLDMSRGLRPLMLLALSSLAALVVPYPLHAALILLGISLVFVLWGAKVLPFSLAFMAGASMARLAVSVASSPWHALTISHLYHGLDFLSVVLAFGILLSPILARPAARYLALLGMVLRTQGRGLWGWAKGRVLLAGAIVEALIVSALPYSPTLNPLGRPVQVDAVFYYR